MFAETLSAGTSDPRPCWQQLLQEQHLDLETILSELPGSPLNGQSQSGKVELIQRGLSLLTEPGQIVELRILGISGKKRTDSGYFDNLTRLAKAAAAYDGKAEGVYFTLNPVHPALIARASNRIKEYAQHTTSDNDIIKRINLPIDFDPVRPAGISSTTAEKQAALRRAWLCRAWLTTQGWPDPVFADSGNGAHLIYAIDLPNNAESSALVKNCLLVLSSLFSDDVVKVDTSTGNASRIFKLYGTLACKGDNTPERPHRRSAILAAPDHRQSVGHAQLSALAARATRVEKPAIPGVPASASAANREHATAYAQAAFKSEIAALSAVRDGNRNNQLFQSAAALFSLVAAGALDRNEVWQTLVDTAKAIGLSESEALRTIESGEKHGLEHPRGVPQPLQAQKTGDPTRLSLVKESTSATKPNVSPTPAPVSVPPDASAAPRQRLMHVDELDTLPPIRWLIQDILPANGLAEVFGAPGAGKTQVVFDIAQTLASSGQTVIYVVAEGLQGYRARKRAWQAFRKRNGGGLFIWSEAVHLFDAASVQTFIQVIQPQKPVLVVFDTLSRCSLGADENSQKDMNFILDALDRVRRETGATVVAVHHTNAAGVRERGSNVIRGGIDVMIEVAKDDDLMVLSCIKMKDSDAFAPLFLKPVLVDIGEDKPVPVLVPAEKRLQTPADKLTALQLDILKAIGLEMFAESGIKSTQLDELLPPTAKRASKYYGLNTLIKLGYVKPHVKGDPYWITEEGRLKLSNADNGAGTGKSSQSKASPSPFIWTLPESSPMSSPIPHTFRCGMDQTSDSTTTNEPHPIAIPEEPSNDAGHLASNALNTAPGSAERTPSPTLSAEDPSADGARRSHFRPSAGTEGPPGNTEKRRILPGAGIVLSALDIARYAAQLGVRYPTTRPDDLYRIATIIPCRLRNAFEVGLGEACGAYLAEVSRRGEPDEQAIPDILALYLLPGLVSAAVLFESYQHAVELGHGPAFVSALSQRSTKAVNMLRVWTNGDRRHSMTCISRTTGVASTDIPRVDS